MKDKQILKKIAERIRTVYSKENENTIKALIYLVEACHTHIQPLRLEDMLNADDFNFSHDVSGIYNHIDLTNMELKNHFSPRFSKRV